MKSNQTIPKRILLIIPVLVLGAVYVLAGLIPINSLWGFNELRYFPNYVAIIYAVLFLSIILPFVYKSAAGAIVNLSKKFQSLPLVVRLIVIAIISGAIFYIFRVHVHSLGDGYQRIYQVEKGYWYYNTEPLDFFLHELLFRLLMLFGIVSGELSYTILSIVSGIVFVLTVYLIKFPDDTRSENIVLIKLIAVSLGGMQMFFGYVESYTFFYLFALLFLLWAVRFLLSKKGLITASILLALAMASHITAGFLLPAFIYLIWFNLKKIRPKSFVPKYLPIIIVLLVILGHIGAEIRLKYFEDVYTSSFAAGILPIYSYSKYSVLSAIHLYDIINQLLLITPAALVLKIYFLTDLKFDSDKKDLNRFLGILILCAFLVLLLVDPKLGYARDWDLFSISAAALGLSVVILLAAGLKASGRLNRYSVFVIVSLSFLLLSGWILTNASPERQLKRAEDLLSLSEKGRGYSTELLAYYYRMEKHDSEKSLQLLETITGPARNSRVYGKMAKTQLDLHRDDDALKSASRGIALDSSNGELQVIVGFIWLKKGRPDLALPRMLKAAELTPDRPEIYHFLCNIYAGLDSLGKAIAAAHQAMRLKPDYAIPYIELGELFYRMHVYDSALVYTKAGLKLDPSNSTGYQILEDIKKNYQPAAGQ
jgi:tetratricopeptide (TPR) repeat protein